MIFSLKVLRNGKEEFWKYDNVTSSVYNNKNEELFPNSVWKGNIVKDFDRTYSENKKSKDNRLLEISLGMKCNFHCNNCSQTNYRNLAYSSSPKDVVPFIEKLKNSGLKCKSISLIGGEPLVYWKVIKKLIPELRKLYPINDTFISFSTNGSLLTRDKVDFMKKYDISMFIFHDAFKNSENDPDILDNKEVVDAILYAQKVLKEGAVSILSGPSSKNYNSVQIIKFFKKNISNESKISSKGVLKCHVNEDPNGNEFKNSSDMLSKYSNSIFSVLNSEFNDRKTNSMAGDNSLWKYRNSLIESIINKKPMSAIISKCLIESPYGLTVNMKGDIIKCHNFPERDNFDYNLDNLNEVVVNGFKHVSKRNLCKDCLVVHSCKGPCPYSTLKRGCTNLFALHWGIFRAAFASLFGVVVLDYEPV